ncbi:MAG: indole-3-glycerol-phosphate synthase TrpC, partial [Deltaproteobacteria bacterium]|nr:indole-3-glycerol-phosphate synthase TrpC [Deltaproteobacteria bacterium]
MAATGILAKILEEKQVEVAALRKRISWASLEEQARAVPTPRDFVASLRAAPRPRA